MTTTGQNSVCTFPGSKVKMKMTCFTIRCLYYHFSISRGTVAKKKCSPLCSFHVVCFLLWFQTPLDFPLTIRDHLWNPLTKIKKNYQKHSIQTYFLNVTKYWQHYWWVRQSSEFGTQTTINNRCGMSSIHWHIIRNKSIPSNSIFSGKWVGTLPNQLYDFLILSLEMYTCKVNYTPSSWMCVMDSLIHVLDQSNRVSATFF